MMPMRSEAEFRSLHARAYFDRLTRHFSHKIPVAVDGDRAQLRFSCGLAEIHVDGRSLLFLVRSESASDRKETCAVLSDHMRRFAWREDKSDLVWTDLDGIAG